jgi:hypothetical protein
MQEVVQDMFRQQSARAVDKGLKKTSSNSRLEVSLITPPHRLTASPPHRLTASPPHRLTASSFLLSSFQVTSSDDVSKHRKKSIQDFGKMNTDR